jgi:hypothetical protein
MYDNFIIKEAVNFILTVNPDMKTETYNNL